MPVQNGYRSPVERYRETSIAFDDMIVQVGRAIARAQDEMDLAQADFQRQVVLALKEGKMSRLDIKQAAAFTIPKTDLEL